MLHPVEVADSSLSKLLMFPGSPVQLVNVVFTKSIGFKNPSAKLLDTGSRQVAEAPCETGRPKMDSD